MTKVSASTLARQAAKTKDKAEAKRLRARAAKLRRERRAADAAGLAITEAQRKPRPMKGLPDREAIIKRVNKRIVDHADLHGAQAILSQARAANVDSMPLASVGERPGHGEIVGGRIAAVADVFAKLARKKGGIDAIQSQLSNFEANARYEAARSADERTQKVAQEANERWRTNIVTGFMARMQGLEQMSRNGLPDAVVVDGVTLARVVDALAAAGYTPTGKR